MFDKIWSYFAHDIGIDLGTVNTLVLVKGKGIVIREPTVVALHRKTRQVLAIGSEAKRMLGRTPAAIEAVRPLRDGVISDFDTTEAMLRYFIHKVHQSPQSSGWRSLPKIPRPRVVVGIPSGVTEVERRAVQDACLVAGARQAFLIEEPMAAAIGAKLPVEEPEGVMVVDIGGGTTEIAVISLGGMVINRSLRVAGDELDEDIINYMRTRYGMLIGERSAEEAKIEIGSAYELGGKDNEATVIRGRDLSTGLPKSLKITASEIREALTPTVTQIVGVIKEVLEETPPELLTDIVERGIYLAGGGALLRGLDKKIAEETKLPVYIADDPLTTVVRGCGEVLDNLDLLAKVKVTGGLR
ncbi:rod shape-determining protein [Candidatus Daviesbacteria bacterium RIFCSPLOWO2_02_FULL_38_18]|nr:MAG: rod shape-determining protein [Candidatus Daviesbacteria bacterium RIFCSPHIGHO2_02_FULL_39_41]OGE45774.1 MAG: rod shape-determining protein [Candidatus Daviesbacteria bacterium RIFCSPHIGHO2_12_FULL_38_25]OGE68989.1 MAG: rod shape-determining protein [Candidatus Daviesbacteria bacterium RIFCSPLOWO2_02_FULL_38_18]HCB23170.1 rod shape-determining protein [Candidatus Daviesbacteria bacterium]